jgi:hypothetical protein
LPPSALRQKPEWYLGPATKGSRARRLVMEGLWSVGADASFAEHAAVRLLRDEERIVIRHDAGGTPLTSPGVDLDLLIRISSQVGHQAQHAGLSPYSSWIGLPLLAAFSDDVEIDAFVEGARHSLVYREGNLISSAVSAAVVSEKGIVVRFAPSAALVGPVDDTRVAAQILSGEADTILQSIQQEIRTELDSGMADANRPHCSFCGENETPIRRLIRGPRAAICTDCIQRCRSNSAELPTSTEPLHVRWWHESGHRPPALEADGKRPGACSFCGKGWHAVRTVVTEGASICADCIEVAANS